MDRIKACFDQINIIRGVGKGIITKEQIQILTIKYHLNHEEEKAFYKMLGKHNIRLSSEADITENDEITTSTPAEERGREVTVQEWEKRFGHLYQQFQEEMRKNPYRLKRYEMEKPIFIDIIAKYAVDSEGDVLSVICEALFEMGYMRVMNMRKTGWVCGTHTRIVKEKLNLLLLHYFSQEELAGLIRYCEEGETGSKKKEHWDKVLLVLLFKVPRIIVHQRSNWDELE